MIIKCMHALAGIERASTYICMYFTKRAYMKDAAGRPGCISYLSSLAVEVMTTKAHETTCWQGLSGGCLGR